MMQRNVRVSMTMKYARVVRFGGCEPVCVREFSKHMPFVKCLLGFAEVPYQVPPWSLHVAKNKPKEAYLVRALKARLYPKVLIAKCLPGGAEGPCQGQPLSPPKML